MASSLDAVLTLSGGTFSTTVSKTTSWRWCASCTSGPTPPAISAHERGRSPALLPHRLHPGAIALSDLLEVEAEWHRAGHPGVDLPVLAAAPRDRRSGAVVGAVPGHAVAIAQRHRPDAVVDTAAGVVGRSAGHPAAIERERTAGAIDDANATTAIAPVLPEMVQSVSVTGLPMANSAPLPGGDAVRFSCQPIE